MENIELGDMCQDVVTGFKGVAVGKINYLTGCDQIGLCPKVGKDGKVADTIWFDITRMKKIRGSIKLPGQTAKRKASGAGPAPSVGHGRMG